MSSRTLDRRAGLAPAMLLLCAVAGCATGRASEREQVSTTTTTGYTPTGVQLYVARSSSQGCERDLAEAIHFADGADAPSPPEMVDVQQWSACLNRAEMKDATVVLTGGLDPEQDEGLFARRATTVRTELARRGVDPSRIVIGTPNATREGGRMGPSNAIRLELSSASSLRALR